MAVAATFLSLGRRDFQSRLCSAGSTRRAVGKPLGPSRWQRHSCRWVSATFSRDFDSHV